MLRKSLISVIILGWCILTNATAQTVVAFQGGEGTASDNWNFTPITNAGGPLPPGIVSANSRTGTFAIRAGGGNNTGCSGGANCIVGGQADGCSLHGKTITFDPVNVSCLSDVQLSCYHRSQFLCSGNGFDSGERIFFEVRLNGGSWVSADVLEGFGDYTWNYTTNPAGHTTGTVPNPFVYDVPAGTNTFQFRLRAVLNRSDEVFYVDDVKLTTTSTAYNFPGTAGLWNGEVNTDWANACNWDTRVIPTSGNDVYIPNSANNICEVLAGTTANCLELKIDKDKLAVEYNTSAINVYGDLIIESNGLLDMDLAGTQGGILNLRGNWINKRDESYFQEGLSSVSIVGTTNQSITVNNDTKESFYKFRVNKLSGLLSTDDDIWIDQANAGGATAMLTLSSGLFDLNTHELKIWNENFQSVSRTGGGIISEQTNNSSRITRVMNANTGNYIFPFSKADGTYIPFVFNQTAGNAGSVTAATYATPPDNLPWPNTPVSVSNLISASGLSPDNRDATVDRFWQIDAANSSTADLTFNYAVSELPIPPYDNPLTLKAQRYNSSTNLWQPYLPGQGSNYYFVYVPGVSTFSTWTLTNIISPLPVELLMFDAVLNDKNKVDLTWATASELNNDYFTLEKSTDGIHFVEFAKIGGAGTTSGLSYYESIDENPYQGVSYYRLMQTDFDGRYSYSQIVKIRNIKKHGTSFSIFPNPADDYFYIVVEETNDGDKIIIRDVTGKFIRELIPDESKITGSKLLKVDTSSFARGLYFISNSEGFSQKIVLY